MSRKPRIEEVKELLAGNHKTQQRKVFGFTGKPTEKRSVGDTWTEVDDKGNSYDCEQKQGYIVRRPSGAADFNHHDLMKTLGYMNCPKESCDARDTRLDKKVKFKTGMCYDCLCKHEDDLRIQGKFEEYEKQKMLDRARGYFKDSDSFMEEYFKPILEKGYYEEVQSDGTLKRTPVDPETIKEMLNEYEQFKTDVFNQF